MQKRFKVYLTFGILVLIVGGLYIFTNWFSLITGYFKGEDEVVRLAVCLNGKGAEFYGTTFCADCEKQTKAFGYAFSNIKYVDCGKDKEFCPNIRSIPAWYINGQIYYGYKEINELKEISGC
jgi:hypothetical protein